MVMIGIHRHSSSSRSFSKSGNVFGKFSAEFSALTLPANRTDLQKLLRGASSDASRVLECLSNALWMPLGCFLDALGCLSNGYLLDALWNPKFECLLDDSCLSNAPRMPFAS